MKKKKRLECHSSQIKAVFMCDYTFSTRFLLCKNSSGHIRDFKTQKQFLSVAWNGVKHSNWFNTSI